MLKVIGIVMVLLGCTGIGWYTALRYQTRIHLLEEVEQAIQFIYGEVEYAASDMIEIMHRLTGRSNLCQAFWLAMETNLQSYDGRLLYSHWIENMNKISGMGCLGEEDILIIQGVGKNLGNMDRETQLHTLKLFQKRLQHVIVEAKKEYREKRKISSIVGVTAGIFLSVLFI